MEWREARRVARLSRGRIVGNFLPIGARGQVDRRCGGGNSGRIRHCDQRGSRQGRYGDTRDTRDTVPCPLSRLSVGKYRAQDSQEHNCLGCVWICQAGPPKSGDSSTTDPLSGAACNSRALLLSQPRSPAPWGLSMLAPGHQHGTQAVASRTVTTYAARYCGIDATLPAQTSILMTQLVGHCSKHKAIANDDSCAWK